MYLYISIQVDVYYISLCFVSLSRFTFFFCYLLGFISLSCPEYEHVSVWKGIFQLPSLYPALGCNMVSIPVIGSAPLLLSCVR